MERPQHSGIAWADALISALIDNGVDTFLVGPGSRSTPLVLAVARNARARTVVHFDERAVAFAALGFARATGRPAAVITTSGTAVANLFPAVVEASMDAQPMIVLSADRPPELRATGANQTIDQVRIFGSYARYFADVPPPDEHTRPTSALDFVEQACRAARSQTPGPAHLNCMFREPLAPDFSPVEPQGEASAEVVPEDAHGHAHGHAHGLDHQLPGASRVAGRQAEADDMATVDLPVGLIDRIKSARQGIVVVGRLHGLSDARAAERVANLLGWPLFPDIGSQIPRTGDSRVVVSYDRILDDTFARLHRPDIVVHLGGSFVSKRLGLWLAASKPDHVFHVTDDRLPYDPYGVVTARVNCAPSRFAELLAVHGGALGELSREWNDVWQRASSLATVVLGDELDGSDDAAIDEPTLARMVWRHARRGCALLLGNSMPVRDFDAFGWGAAGPQFVATNRGASGIDGLIATSFGVALGRRCPVLAVVGDLSLLHDVGSLTMLAQSEYPVIVVVVNNGGGGIFSFLPIASHIDVFERYFAAAHDLAFENVASFARLDYAAPTTRAQFRGALDDAFGSGRSTLIEVNTSRAENKKLHDRISARFATELSRTK